MTVMCVCVGTTSWSFFSWEATTALDPSTVSSQKYATQSNNVLGEIVYETAFARIGCGYEQWIKLFFEIGPGTA